MERDIKLYIAKKNTGTMLKRGQLGIIEFKYFMLGGVIFFFLALLLVYLGNVGVLPFKIPLVCPVVAQ